MQQINRGQNIWPHRWRAAREIKRGERSAARPTDRPVSATNRDKDAGGGEPTESRAEQSEWIRDDNTLTSLSPFFFLVWTERDSTSLSNWSTCMFNVSIVFWRRDGKKNRVNIKKSFSCWMITTLRKCPRNNCTDDIIFILSRFSAVMFKRLLVNEVFSLLFLSSVWFLFLLLLTFSSKFA